MVCYSLSPRDGQLWLTPSDVVKRLRTAFAYVNYDAQEGIEYASQVLNRMKEMSAPKIVIKHLEQRYKDAMAIAVSHIGPDSDERLAFVVMPEESIKIYSEPQLLSLVQQCMATLEYEMMEL